jgi:YD repeat-containing protein
VKVFMKTGAVEKVVTRTVYGESLDPTPPAPGATAPTPAQALNLRGQAYLVFNSAGLLKNQGHDFKGNLMQSSRRLAKAYQATPEWTSLLDGTPAEIENAAGAMLEAESFTTITTYDALRRVVTHTTPDGKVTVPTYNEANLLNAVSVTSGSTTTPVINNIDYNAKGQRILCEHAGYKIEYAYDPKTFRLAHLWTTRASDSRLLQDLRYTYDPVVSGKSSR